MIPAFKIVADGEDVTAKIKDRLIYLKSIDEDGIKADRLSITLDDRDAKLELPKTDIPLDVSLGFEGQQLHYIGRYVVDKLGGEGPVLNLSIGATAANMVGSIRSPKTRAWEGQTLSQIVEKIASETGLKPVIGQSLSNVDFAYLAQTAESDLHFLTRIARDLDATAKPAGGTLLVQRRGEGLNAEGEKLEPIKIGTSRLSEWRWDEDEREAYKSVEAEWGNSDEGSKPVVKVGNGEPVHRLRHTYPNAAEAKRAAEAELALSGRSVVTSEFVVSGFEPSLFAGGQADLSGLRKEHNGVWHVERVDHTLNAALITKFKARKARD